MTSMRIALDHVSATEAGDYYQVLFEDEGSSTAAYVLIQCQSEDSDDDLYFVETHNPYYVGHFRVRRASFGKTHFSLELWQEERSELEVTFRTTVQSYDEVARILKIMIPSIGLVEASDAC